jgi:two-component system, cell cycle sensor histidine kinase and response regulator CckA
MKTTSRFMLLNVLIVTVAIIATTVFFLGQMHAEAKRQANAAQDNHLRTFWQLLSTKGKDFRLVNGTMLVDNYVINGNHELPDTIKELFGGTATIFMDDTRIATNIMQEDGTRALGTKLVGPAHEALFHQGKQYRGEATILGIPYFTAYDPIRNQRGEIIGALYVGIKKSEFFATYDMMVTKAIVVVALLILFFALLATLVRRQERYATTAIQQREKVLREQVHFLQVLIDTIPNPIFYKDLEGKYLGCNTAFARMFDLSLHEILGKTASDLSPPELAATYRQKDSELLNNPNIQTYESKILPADGAIRDVLFYKAPFNDQYNQVAGIVGIILDITERKHMEEALKNREEEFRSISNELQVLLEAIPDAVILYTPELTIQWANHNTGHMMKKDTDKIIGKYCYEAWHNSSQPCHICPIKESISLRGYVHKELSFSDGTIRDIHASPIFSSEGTITGIVSINRDITEQRRTQTQLNHLQKMDAIGQLAGGIAHDFNNILTAIIGYGHLLQLKTAEEAPTRKYIDSILFAAERAADLTGNLLAFSRKKAFNPTTLDLNECIRKIDPILTRLIREDLEFKRNIHTHPLPILADSGQLEQILINLVTNARDAIPEAGAITIKTMPVHLEKEFIEVFGFGVPGTYAAISISDTGSGMEDKIRERIFEPFFTTKETGKGTGLGLAIVYGIVKQHGGYINVESEPGKGTTFTVYLPLTDELEKAPAVEMIPSTLLGSETILIAEDEDDLRAMLRSVLEENGYTVLEAVNGEEALDTYREHKELIKLMILDLIMPKKNAKEVFETINKISTEMNFLLISGHGEQTIQESGILGNNVKILTKPASPPRFLKLVRDILDGKAC